MHGVSKITSADNIMLFSFAKADTLFMVKTLNTLASAGVVVDMISQTAPSGQTIRFSFTAGSQFFETAIKAINKDDKAASPMISRGYSKINLYGKEMVDSVGVAARALAALHAGGLEISMITTSDLDISLLLRQEDEDIAINLLRDAFSI